MSMFPISRPRANACHLLLFASALLAFSVQAETTPADDQAAAVQSGQVDPNTSVPPAQPVPDHSKRPGIRGRAGDQGLVQMKAEVRNLRQGSAYQRRNQSVKGVVTLPSGLQYQVMKAGTGARPTEWDKVVCNYRGMFIDGTEFEHSEAGKPANLELAPPMIAGWKEALKLMPAGSKWRLVIPPELAYGEAGSPPTIGPNATLVYELELVAVNPAH